MSSQEARLTIDTDDEIQRWRYRCPRGHSQFEPTNHHWYCTACARSHDDVDPEFTELVDKQTGEVYERDEVNIKGYRSKTA
ncbi:MULTISPECIES: hypothetical protein [Halobacterium]|uniref:hypothetical protein n=1 Tax=Halobacterium TaxID=2239 RepID=UPI00073F9D0B|nr:MULTISPECIES: hypothetical protein [Halobacterium]MCG1002854.1 hypothetical protein [Halobacterium noricense]